MADIKKTLGQLQTLYADNTNAEISPNDLRDGFKTAIGSMNVYATSTNYTADADDIVIEVDTSSGDVTITIPGANASDGSGDTFNQKIFYIINTGANDVILSGGATNTVAANSTLGIISNGTSWLSINASGDTDLSEGTTTNTTVDVNSSTGTNATLAEASTTRAGVMSKAKFDEVVANTAKDGITTAQANAIIANTAKDGITTAQANAIIANTAKDGITTAQVTKLAGIESFADKTDTTNVTAAGALMDSEVTNLAQVKAFDSSDYATAAQGTLATNALPKSGGAMTGAITTNSTFDGRDVATDGTKLDTIENNADVTDTANVTTAGALMDSEVTNLAQVKAFDSSDYAPSSTVGLTDGDKGDIVVSSTGTVLTIEDDAVTFAKTQNIATNKLLGKGTAGSGSIEEITLGTNLSFSGTTLNATGTDVNAVHTNIANEITPLTAKATPIAADVILIEDSADSNNKKKVTIGNLPFGDVEKSANQTFTGLNTFSALTSLDGDAEFKRSAKTFDVMGMDQGVTLDNLDTAFDVGHYVTDPSPTGIPTGWTERVALTITGHSAFRKQVVTNLNSSQSAYYGKSMSRVGRNVTTTVIWSDWRMMGDVEGPSSSTDTAIPVYDGTTGKLIKDSGVLIDSSDNVTIPGQLQLNDKLFLNTISTPASPSNGHIWRTGGVINVKGDVAVTNDITATGDMFANDITATGTIKAAGSGTATEFLNGLGQYSVPAGGGGGTASPMSVMVLTSTVDTATFGINSPLIVPWNSEKYKDTGFSHSNSTNTTRAIVDNDGTYQIQGRLRIKNTVNQRAQPTVNILKNGSLLQGSLDSSYIRNATGASDYWTLNFVYEPEKLSATDYIEVQLTLDTDSLGSFTSSTLIGSESSLSITNLQGTKGDQGPAGGLLSSVGGGLLVDLGFGTTNQAITTSNGATTINFDDTVTGAVDKHGNWDNTNKKFIVNTASGAGTYQFEANIFASNNTAGYYNLQAFVNGTIKTPNGAFAMGDAIDDSAFDGVAGTISLDLDVGDEVEIKLQAYGVTTTISSSSTWNFAQGMRVSKTSGVKGDTGTGATADLNKALTLESPTASENITIWRTNVAITIEQIHAVSTGTSPDTTFKLWHATNRNEGSPSAIISFTQTTSETTGDVITPTGANGVIPAGDWIWFQTNAASGTDVILTVNIRYTEN